jgi:aminopeptidase N
MTDRFNALHRPGRQRHELAGPRWTLSRAVQGRAAGLDKWFALQAGAPDRGGNVLPAVRQLMQHPDFSLKQPQPRAQRDLQLLQRQPRRLPPADAAGYVFWSDRVLELDAINPQVAARLARAMDRWKKLAEPYRSAAREAIARVAAKPDLSNDVREVVTRALAE